ncbi:YcxB family protein [Pedobacter steynii]|nr:YcxB family protein [Pedobacter steynii]NQX42984.1 YcxB family protein [Pedobacter steynii]
MSLLLACYGYLKEGVFLMYYGLFCTFLVLCFGNIYLRWRHKRHYKKHVKNNFNCQSEESVQIKIIDDHIRMIDSASDSNVKISEIKAVNEIKDYYFLKLSTGPNLIIPKTLTSLNNEVNEMIRNHNIPHFVQLDWKWR